MLQNVEEISAESMPLPIIMVTNATNPIGGMKEVPTQEVDSVEFSAEISETLQDTKVMESIGNSTVVLFSEESALL